MTLEHHFNVAPASFVFLLYLGLYPMFPGSPMCIYRIFFHSATWSSVVKENLGASQQGGLVEFIF